MIFKCNQFGVKYPLTISDVQEFCTNVPELTKHILDCRLLANQEEISSNSLEKMKNCLQERFLLLHKGSTSGNFCVGANNVINRITTCKTSSNIVDEFKDCLFKRILELQYGENFNTTSTTTVSQPGKI